MTDTQERAADPTPDALEFYRREVLPWLRRYSTTPSAYQDRNGASLLDRFAAERVEAERARIALRVSERCILRFADDLDPLVQVNEVIQDLAHDIETDWIDYEEDEP